MGISSAFFRFYFDTKDEAQRTLVVRTSFWFTMTMATAGLVVGCGARRPDRRLAPARRRPVARSRGVRRALGADELRAADLALPRRGAVDRVRRRQRRERADHRRRHRPARRRSPQGPDRRRRRQLHRHAHRLRRATRLPPLPARPPVLTRPASADEPLRHAARPVRARALGDQLHRPDLHRPVQGPGRGRRLLRRRADRQRDRLPDDRLPPRLAGVRVLDRGRPRGQARVLVRPHVPALRLLLALGRARRARAVARRPARPEARVPPRRRRRRAARLRRDGLRGLHGGRDRDRPRPPDAVQLDRRRGRRGDQHRPQRHPDPALRDDRRRDLDRRRLPRPLPVDGAELAARVPGRLPVAPRGDPRVGRDRADRRSAASSTSRSRSRS